MNKRSASAAPAKSTSAPVTDNQGPSRAAESSSAARSGPQRPSAAFVGLFVASGLLLVLLLRPFAVGLFLAACLAQTTYPLHRRLERRLARRGGGKALAAGLSTLVLLGAVITPLAALLGYAASAAADGIAFVRANCSQEHLTTLLEGRVPGPLRPWVERMLSSVHVSIADIEQYGEQVTNFLQEITPKVAGASLEALSTSAFVLFGFYAFVKDGPKLLAHAKAISPLQKRHTEELFDDFRAVSSASLLGMLFTAVGQSLVLSAGFALAGFSQIFFLGLLTFVAAFVPLAGTLLIWLPMALAAGVLGSAKAGLLLGIYSVVATNVVDGLLKPMVMQGSMEMPGALTFLGILGGLGFFGPVGLIAGPLCFAFFLSFLQIYEREYLPRGRAADKPRRK